MSTSTSPLHAEILPRLDPEYAAFYNKYLADKPGLHEIPWSPSIRDAPAQPGGSDPLPVGSIRDVDVGTCKARVFTPEGEAPSKGWPIIIYFHGGGWTLGNIDAENAFATNLCRRANTVVFSVDYRLAPENPYPAAADDAWGSLQWVHKNGHAQLGVDLSKLALGGSSSGGNLAAVLTHKAALHNPSIPIIFQLLIVPVIDNTPPDNQTSSDHPYPSWYENRYTPSLSPAKMLWFRNFYLPNVADRKEWDASPILAPEQSFRDVPNAWIAVCELDILRDEGIKYAEVLRKYNKEVEVVVYKGSPHPIMANDKFVAKGREMITDACNALSKVFARA